jgi:hypothetical protein
VNREREIDSYLVVKKHPPGASSRRTNPNILQIACCRREEKSQKMPLCGNIRRGQELWPKNLFAITLPALAMPASGRRRLSFTVRGACFDRLTFCVSLFALLLFAFFAFSAKRGGNRRLVWRKGKNRDAKS